MLDQTPPAGPVPDLGEEDQTPSTWTTLKRAVRGRGAFLPTLALWVAGSVVLGIAFVLLNLVNRGIRHDVRGEGPPPAGTRDRGAPIAAPPRSPSPRP